MPVCSQKIEPSICAKQMHRPSADLYAFNDIKSTYIFVAGTITAKRMVAISIWNISI